MKKFALLSYTATANLGDEIQSLAARRFLPRIDGFADREHLNAFQADGDAPHWMIMNGWFAHLPENWPPSPALRPLPVSVHISPDPGAAGGVGLVAADILLSQPLKRYLGGFGPVGARDLPTLQRLKAAGVESYFSGCLTLTLPRPDVVRDNRLLVLNDVPREVFEAIRRATGKRVVATTHWNEQTTVPAERFALAETLLATYAQASCVVTSRLHCALPCVAIGTPVLLLDVASDQHRFDGLHDFVRHCPVRTFLEGGSGFDADAPTPNPDRHVPYAARLRERVTGFVDAPEQPAAPYPLSAADLLDGLRLINRKTTELLYGERSRRITLQTRPAQAPAQAQ